MRKRTIDHQIWRSKSLSKHKLNIRLLYLGLISTADDEGRFCADPQSVKATIFPFDQINLDTIRVWLLCLASGDDPLVRLYEVKGNLYGVHPNWHKHQHMRYRAVSYLPSPPQDVVVALPMNDGIKSSEVKPSKENQDDSCEGIYKAKGIWTGTLRSFCQCRKGFNACVSSVCFSLLDDILEKVDAKHRAGAIRDKSLYIQTSVNNLLIEQREQLTQARKETGK